MTTKKFGYIAFAIIAMALGGREVQALIYDHPIPPLPPLAAQYLADYGNAYEGTLLFPDSPEGLAYFQGEMDVFASMYYSELAYEDCATEALNGAASALMYAQLFAGYGTAQNYFYGQYSAYMDAYYQAVTIGQDDDSVVHETSTAGYANQP